MPVPLDSRLTRRRQVYLYIQVEAQRAEHFEYYPIYPLQLTFGSNTAKGHSMYKFVLAMTRATQNVQMVDSLMFYDSTTLQSEGRPSNYF